MPTPHLTSTTYTDQALQYLALAWQCFESEPKVHPCPIQPHQDNLHTHDRKQIDYDKFKTVAGLASAHSARELMRVTKNKLKSEYGALSGGMKDANAATVRLSPFPPTINQYPSTCQILTTLKPNGTTPTTTPQKTQKSTPASRKRATPAKRAKANVLAEEAGSGDDEESASSPPPAKKARATPKPSKMRGDGGVKVESVEEHAFEGDEDVFT